MTTETPSPDAKIFKRLLEERIVFLGTEVTDESANQVCAQLLILNSVAPSEDIYLYINSPGGSITAGFAIYDTMNFVQADVGVALRVLRCSFWVGAAEPSAARPGNCSATCGDAKLSPRSWRRHLSRWDAARPRRG